MSMSKKNKNKKLPFYYRIKCTFWRALIAPFCMCKEHKLQFFLWVMFIVVASQLGTIISLIQRVVFGDWQIRQALCSDSVSGNFYTFSLVLIASLLAPLFSKIIEDKKYNYRSIGIVFTTLLIFSLIFCAVFFASSTHDITFYDYRKISPTDIHVDWYQLGFFILTILFAWYSFGFSKLIHHEDLLNLADTKIYNFKKENMEVEDLSHAAVEQTEDGSGNQL